MFSTGRRRWTSTPGKGPSSRENPLPARRKSMRKIKEVLRLRNELKLDQRQIARSCSISVSTVHEYLKRAEAAKVGWPLPEGWDDTRLEAALFPPVGSPPQPSTQKSPPDFAAIHEQLQRHRHVTLQLLWEEYRDSQPGWLSLQPLLRTVPALAQEARRGAAAGAQGRRESLRRLGRRDHSDLRP